MSDDLDPVSAQEESDLVNLEVTLPEPLDFVSDNPLSVSDVSETPDFETLETLKKEVIRDQRSVKQRIRGVARQSCLSDKEAIVSGEGDRVANGSEV